MKKDTFFILLFRFCSAGYTLDAVFIFKVQRSELALGQPQRLRFLQLLQLAPWPH